jgi:hypothetical protein
MQQLTSLDASFLAMETPQTSPALHARAAPSRPR